MYSTHTGGENMQTLSFSQVWCFMPESNVNHKNAFLLRQKETKYKGRKTQYSQVKILFFPLLAIISGTSQVRREINQNICVLLSFSR